MRAYFFSGRKMVLLVVAVVVPLIGGYLMSLERAAVPTVAEPIYNGPEDGKRVALTINVDWGEEYLPAVLETCKLKNVKLTFFVTGRWAAKFPDLVKQMAAAGHEIGSHGYAHPHPDHLSVDGNMRDIQKAEEVLQDILGVKPRLYAPPYGERGNAVLLAAEQLGYKTILWSVDSVDWKYRDQRAIIKRVTRKIHPGGIVLMHPTAATAAALPDLIDELRMQGYEVRTVSELLEQGKGPDNAGPLLIVGTYLGYAVKRGADCRIFMERRELLAWR